MQRPSKARLGKRIARLALADFGFADVGTLSNGRFAPEAIIRKLISFV